MTETHLTIYKPAFAKRAREKCANGLTDREIAAEFGVSRNTIFQWRTTYPEFAEATALGRAEANERVERTLYERAIGYEEEAVRLVLPAGAAAPLIVRYAREVRPDIRAQLHWLRVRDPRAWASLSKADTEDDGFIQRVRKAMPRGLPRDGERHRAGSVPIGLSLCGEGLHRLQPSSRTCT